MHSPMSMMLGQWSIGPIDKRKAKRERRLHREPIVRKIASILASGETSKFEFEAACRHGLRAQRCLDGERWAEADKWAALIVQLALHRIGAVRPRWQEGQPEWTQDGHAPVERFYCANPKCHKPLPEGHYKFCSRICATVVTGARYQLSHREEIYAQRAARRAAWSAQQPDRACEHCGKRFRPKSPGQRFCSALCGLTSHG